MKPRVLITYIESGMGHIMSATAIHKKLSEKYGEKFEIIGSEIMKEDHNEVSIKFENFLMKQTKMTNSIKGYGPAVFVFLNLMGRLSFMRFIHKTFFRKAVNACVESLHKHHADIIISTHYFITYCAIELKRRYMENVTLITYNPDNNVHVWWDNRGDIFINNNPKACDEAIRKRHFSNESIKQVYFTAREEIVNAKGTKEEYRYKHNIPQERFTVMVADGAYASGKAKKVTKKLLKTKKEMTIIILAGKNERVYQYFAKRSKKLPPNIVLIPVRFTPLAYELYGASDLFISKAGPNALLDCCFMKTPIIVDYYAHPIEKATTKLFIDEMQMGLKVLRSRNILKVVEDLMDNPQKMDFFRRNLDKLDKHQNGAGSIADIIYEELKKAGKIDAEGL